MKCAVNQRQVVIALTGGELVYFEMDPVCTSFYILLYLPPPILPLTPSVFSPSQGS